MASILEGCLALGGFSHTLEDVPVGLVDWFCLLAASSQCSWVTFPYSIYIQYSLKVRVLLGWVCISSDEGYLCHAYHDGLWHESWVWEGSCQPDWLPLSLACNPLETLEYTELQQSRKNCPGNLHSQRSHLFDSIILGCILHIILWGLQMMVWTSILRNKSTGTKSCWTT